MIIALFGYPLLGYLFGHIYPYLRTFGVPCPTTIFTFGVLICSENKVPKVILLVPFVWSLLGFSAAAKLGIQEDTALLVTGFISTVILLMGIKIYKPAHRWLISSCIFSLFSTNHPLKNPFGVIVWVVPKYCWLQLESSIKAIVVQVPACGELKPPEDKDGQLC